jgi:hypothetical protein
MGKQNRKPARKYKALTDKQKADVAEQFENLMFRFVGGDTKSECLLSLTQVESIVNGCIKIERAEIHAEFEPEPLTRLKRKAGKLLSKQERHLTKAYRLSTGEAELIVRHKR